MKNVKITFIFTFVFIIHIVYSYSQISSVFLKENFNDLENWTPLYFPKIEKHSLYTIEYSGEGNYLKAISQGSASGLVFKNEFNPYDFPFIKWRWKIDNIYKKGDATKKEGDDYPIRVYILFKFNPGKSGLVETLQYKYLKLIYGTYPPHSSLNYIWANRSHPDRIMASSYTKRTKIIVLEQGTEKVGKWVDENVNIVEDYRKAFGKDPPDSAGIAIMNDSDNTGENSRSYVDYIEIYGEKP